MLRLLLPLLLLAGCSSANRVLAPLGEDEPLPTVTPEAVGLDAWYLENAARQLAEREDDHEVHSMLVVRGGRLAFERYYNGHGRDNPHDLRSATKSITSLLTGIAFERGALADTDTPLMYILGDNYPEVKNKGDLTLRHLLTMSSGLDCDDGDRRTRGQEDRMYRSTDWVDYFLSLDRTFAPGDSTRYCTGGVIALGEAIAQSTSQDIATFADETLFRPLGIRNYEWARFDGGRKVDTGGHLLLTPQGMAKIGLLVLNQGRWDGQQVVSADWIEESTQPHTTMRGEPYGYLWWLGPLRYGEKTVDVISARGNGGQAILIVPEYDLVAVFTGGFYNSDRVGAIYEIFYSAVLPSVKELHPYLPPRPQ